MVLVKEKEKEKAICKEFPNGSKYWRLNNDKLHREDGAAIEYAYGDKSWYINGKLHREDGPAMEWDQGRRLGWFLNGKQYKEKDYWKELYKRKKITKTELFLRLI